MIYLIYVYQEHSQNSPEITTGVKKKKKKKTLLKQIVCMIQSLLEKPESGFSFQHHHQRRK